MSIDRRYERIARSLSTLELVGDEGPDLIAELLPASPAAEGARPGCFAGFYSRTGIERALDAYGVTAAIQRAGFDGAEVAISFDDAGRHRLQVVVGGREHDDHRLIDLVIQLRRVREAAITGDEATARPFDVLVVDWLCLQNPRASFSKQRPQLPGQLHPGLGIGRVVHNMILLMARRLNRAGVINVPRHLHLAVFYERFGYRYLCETHQSEVSAVTRALRGVPPAVSSWAAERGCIKVGRNGAPPATWVYQPVEMIAPVSQDLEALLARRGGWLRRLVAPSLHLEVELDAAELAESLRRDPVPGLDPDEIMVLA